LHRKTKSRAIQARLRSNADLFLEGQSETRTPKRVILGFISENAAAIGKDAGM